MNQYIISHTCEEVGLETTTKFLKLFGRFSSCQNHKFFTRFNKSHFTIFYRLFKKYDRVRTKFFAKLTNGSINFFVKRTLNEEIVIYQKKIISVGKYKYTPHNFVVFSQHQAIATIKYLCNY